MDGSQIATSPDIRRRRFSAADVQVMLDAGLLRNGERVELVGGELVEMSPQGPLHWNVTYHLVRWFIRNLPESFGAASQGPFRLNTFNEPEPEIFVFPAALDVNEVRGPDAHLVVEVAHSSLEYDLKIKGPTYAAAGVCEYWVVDVEKSRTLVHRLNSHGQYGEPAAVAFDEPLATPGDLLLTIADLKPKG